MKQEIFEVVNDRDEVIGLAPRNEVHKLGMKHRAAHVLIFNSQGQVFLQKRSATKDCEPGKWDSSAAGHLNPGESYDTCAVREVEEELGFRLPATPQALFKIDACPGTGMEFVWVYRAEAEGPFTLHPEEVSDGGWFSPAEVERWLSEDPDDFAPSVGVIWARLRPLLRKGAP
jgi:isopentenyldiphosphate isomerase